MVNNVGRNIIKMATNFRTPINHAGPATAATRSKETGSGGGSFNNVSTLRSVGLLSWRFYGRKSARDDVWAEITRRGHRGGKGQRVTNNNIAEKPLLIANQERFAEFEPPNELKWTVLMSQPARKHSTVHSFGHTINSRDKRNFSPGKEILFTLTHSLTHTHLVRPLPPPSWYFISF